jgi:hypothetical protein
MIAELKKTQLLADSFEFVTRETPVRRTPARPVSRPTRTTAKPVQSVWLPLPKTSRMENLVHGIVIGIAGGAIVYGVALSINFAEQWNVLSNWILAVVR